MPDYKVGDIVVITDAGAAENHHFFKVGDRCRIARIREDGGVEASFSGMCRVRTLPNGVRLETSGEYQYTRGRWWIGNRDGTPRGGMPYSFERDRVSLENEEPS